MSTQITKSIILQPGEPFTLPPGATIIGSDNPNDLTNSCTQTIPTLVYETVFLEWDVPDVSGVSTEAIEANDNAVWIGLRIGGTYTSFSSGTPWRSSASLAVKINEISITNPFVKNTIVAGFDGDVVSGGKRYNIQTEVLEEYKDDFYAVRYNTVNGDVGAGNDASISTAYVRFKTVRTSLL